MIEKAQNGVSHSKNDLLKKYDPPTNGRKTQQWGKPPKNDLLKKYMAPKLFFKIFFFTKLDKYNYRKTKKWGKPP